MELISVGAHPYKIKKQNSKMYYTIFTEPYKYFRRGFLQSFFYYKLFRGLVKFTFSKLLKIGFCIYS